MSQPASDKAALIKRAVIKNFTQSPEAYDRFETRWGMFAELTRRLILAVGLAPTDRVLDVGCGSGASCGPLVEVLGQGELVGLDITPEMLVRAREAFRGRERVSFVQGDASEMDRVVAAPFDAVLYTASAFLIPDLSASLAAAVRVLKPGGRCGLNYLGGYFGLDGDDLLERAEKEAQTGLSPKRPIYWEQTVRVFEDHFTEVETVTENLEYPREAWRMFFAIPAQSAGLFPRLAYDDRQKMIDQLETLFPDQVIFRWRTLTGTVAG
jgi:SAM-dependent methyltransferase